MSYYNLKFYKVSWSGRIWAWTCRIRVRSGWGKMDCYLWSIHTHVLFFVWVLPSFRVRIETNISHTDTVADHTTEEEEEEEGNCVECSNDQNLRNPSDLEVSNPNPNLTLFKPNSPSPSASSHSLFFFLFFNSHFHVAVLVVEAEERERERERRKRRRISIQQGPR